MKRILVTGGRTYTDRDRVYAALDAVARRHGPALHIIHGGAKGADALAADWALERRQGSDAYPVNHDLDGPWPAAGPRRNGRMLRHSQPDHVIAFPGNDGTQDMCEQADDAGLVPWCIDWVFVHRKRRPPELLPYDAETLAYVTGPEQAPGPSGMQLPLDDARKVDRARKRDARRAPGPLFAGRGR